MRITIRALHRRLPELRAHVDALLDVFDDHDRSDAADVANYRNPHAMFDEEWPMPGRLMLAPRGGLCAVCGAPFAVGDPVVWHDEMGIGACPGRCGHADDAEDSP